MAATFTYGGNDPSQTYYNGNQPTNINSVSPQQVPSYSGSPIGNGNVNTTSVAAPAYNYNYNSSPTFNSPNLNKTTSFSSYSTAPFAAPPSYGPPPAAPDFSQLQTQLASVQRQSAINKAMSDYDALSASTKASGFQSADNAGTTYAQRLMQQGVNPTAAGLVRAQAKLPVYSQLDTINQQKDQTRLTATNQSQQLAAQIANQMASLKLNYAGMLADYNKSNTGFQLDLNKFNAGQAFNEQQYQSDTYFKQQQLAAQLAAQRAANYNLVGGSGGAGGYRGTYRDQLASTMGLAAGNPEQQVSRANLATYLSQNQMWNNPVPNYLAL